MPEQSREMGEPELSLEEKPAATRRRAWHRKGDASVPPHTVIVGFMQLRLEVRDSQIVASDS